jgi:hypothetical protein
MFDRRYFLIAPSFYGAALLSKLLNDYQVPPYREQDLRLLGDSS